jgi:hypothetical protein
MKVITTFTIYGSHGSISILHERFVHEDITMRQIGIKRKHPSTDEWCINTPYFTVINEFLDSEILKYIIYLKRLFNFSVLEKITNIKYVIYIIPVCDAALEEQFYGVLEADTIAELAGIGCTLEFSPAPIMPESRALPTA